MIKKLKSDHDCQTEISRGLEANVWSRFQRQMYADLVKEGNVRSALQFDVFMLFLNNKLYLILTIIGHTINQVEIWNGAKRPHLPKNLVSFKVELRTKGSKGNPFINSLKSNIKG